MGGEGPNVVLTDGDLAVRQEIANVLPQTRHRLCSWHLIRNAETQIRDGNFTAKFAHCMLANCTKEQLDSHWDRLVSRFGIVESPWIVRMTAEKEHWADAYFRGVFCAGMRTTSCNESMNAVIKKNLHERIKLYEFVRVLDRALANVREHESKDDFDSISGMIVPVTHLKNYETQAAKAYTKSIFEMIREELWDEGKLTLKECLEMNGQRVYKFKFFQKLRDEWTVTFDPILGNIKCSCKGMESVGIPCCHSFAIMKAENLQELPRNLILKRWTMSAKSNEGPSNTLEEVEGPSTRLARVAALTNICNKLCNIASLDSAVYEAAKQDLHLLSTKMQELLPSNKKGDHPRSPIPKLSFLVKDSMVTNTKGAPKSRTKEKKRRACSRCKQTGHNAKTCKRKAKARLSRSRTKRHMSIPDKDTISESGAASSS